MYEARIPRWPGSDDWSVSFNTMAAEVERLSRFFAASPLQLDQLPSGPMLSLETKAIVDLTSGSGGGGAGTIAIEEVDGTPAYTGIATLRVDSADGFVLSQPAAGIARLDIAAA